MDELNEQELKALENVLSVVAGENVKCVPDYDKQEMEVQLKNVSFYVNCTWDSKRAIIKDCVDYIHKATA